jgi:RimJ/RimL family protein N-acetyltransferase
MIRFYVWEPGVDPLPDAPPPDGLAVDVWRPTFTQLRPSGLPLLPYAVWWTFHHTRVFANREYGVVVLRKGRTVVHRSLVTPRYFRFADMSDDDLQIGALYTEAEWRGRGLAKTAMRVIIEAWAHRFSKLWYITAEENRASVKLIESCGFRLAGTGARTNRWGLRAFGQFRILNRSR